MVKKVIKLARAWRLAKRVYLARVYSLNSQLAYEARTKLKQDVERMESLFWQALADYDEKTGWDGPSGG